MLPPTPPTAESDAFDRDSYGYIYAIVPQEFTEYGGEGDDWNDLTMVMYDPNDIDDYEFTQNSGAI